MSSSAEPLLDRLAQSGVLSRDDVSHLRATLGSDEQTTGGDDLADQLVQLKKLTPYQAETLATGKLENLVLGNYVILDQLGEGGMGQVYKARHREMDRIVALKVLPPEKLGSKSGVKRFGQEVKAAARLHHPNIVTAFDADISGGIPYLVMEYVEGQDLQVMLARRGPLQIDEAIDLILQTARGLAYAHEVGVIHRDIKPGNLVLDRQGVVRILDMGVAQIRQLAQDEEPDSTQLTRDGAVIGTVDFMSPEQAASAKRADHRSDIYSLGCTLCFLLTNQPVYRGDSVVDRLIAHRERAIPSLREARPDVSPQLEAVFRRMVAKDPDDRYQSVAELVDDLEALQRGTAPSPAPVHRQATIAAEHPPRRRISPATLVLCALAVFALAALGLFYYDDFLPGKGTLHLTVNEPHAVVLVVDDISQALDPQRIRGKSISLPLPPGRYQVQVTKEGFQTSSYNVTLRAWQSRELTVDLQPSPGRQDFINDLLQGAEDSRAAEQP